MVGNSDPNGCNIKRDDDKSQREIQDFEVGYIITKKSHLSDLFNGNSTPNSMCQEQYIDRKRKEVR